MPELSVAGVDRWRKGWIAAFLIRDELLLGDYGDIASLLTDTEHCTAVSIDMPIALPERGIREAEVELRSFLGAAGRSVFYSPTRAALEAAGQAEATMINRAHDGPGISAQAWAITGSIRELRASLRSTVQRKSFHETHPESAFALMNGGSPVPSKRSAKGVIARIDLLRGHFEDLDATLRDAPSGVPIDDVLDAIAAAWSAGRVAAECARRFGPAERDDEDFGLGVLV